MWLHYFVIEQLNYSKFVYNIDYSTPKDKNKKPFFRNSFPTFTTLQHYRSVQIIPSTIPSSMAGRKAVTSEASTRTTSFTTRPGDRWRHWLMPTKLPSSSMVRRWTSALASGRLQLPTTTNSFAEGWVPEPVKRYQFQSPNQRDQYQCDVDFLFEGLGFDQTSKYVSIST